MTLEELHVLFAYDAWANNRVLETCMALTQEQFVQDLGSSFRSVRDTLMHISGAQWIWLERLHGRPAAALPAPDGYPDLASVCARLLEVERNLLAYVDALSTDEVNRIVEYRNTQGEFRTPVVQILQQLVNHGTYHRGQVTTMLRQLGAKPVSTDLILFYRERARQQSA